MAVENEGLKPPRMPNTPQAPSAPPVTPETQVPAQAPTQEPVQPVQTAPLQMPTQVPAQVPTQVPALATQAPVETPVASGIESTGNAVLDVAISTFTTMTNCSAADIARALGKAQEYQDEGLIDLAFIKERFGKHSEQALALAKAVLQNSKAESERNQAAAQSAVLEVAGSAENWNSAVTVFNAHADAETKQMVKVLLDNGLVKQGAAQLMQFVQQSGRVPVVSGTQLQGTPASISAGLSAAEFSTELQKLKTEAAGRSLETGVYGTRYNELMQRRAAGRAAGK